MADEYENEYELTLDDVLQEIVDLLNKDLEGKTLEKKQEDFIFFKDLIQRFVSHGKPAVQYMQNNRGPAAISTMYRYIEDGLIWNENGKINYDVNIAPVIKELISNFLYFANVPEDYFDILIQLIEKSEDNPNVLDRIQFDKYNKYEVYLTNSAESEPATGGRRKRMTKTKKVRKTRKSKQRKTKRVQEKKQKQKKTRKQKKASLKRR